MFYLGWVLLTFTGILASIGAFIWAIRTGQFSDQGRARYLPLRNEEPLSKSADSMKNPIEVYVLFSAFGIGLLALVSTIVLTFFRVGG